jgi:type III restriction enzyme
VQGYRLESNARRLHAQLTDESHMALSTQDVPSRTDVHPVVGEKTRHTLEDLRARRDQEVAFALAKRALERQWPDQPWLFPQLVAISRQWMAGYATYKDGTFPGMLLLAELAERAVDRLCRAITAGDSEQTLRPMLSRYERIGSTAAVSFDTTKPVIETAPDRCHVSHVVADTQSWEQKMATVLEELDEVRCYVKNEGLGFSIPYVIDGDQRGYLPDFILRVDDGHGDEDLLNLIVEVSGPNLESKQAKVSTARDLWVPAVNATGEFGRWDFIEVADPWDAANVIRSHLTGQEAVLA